MTHAITERQQQVYQAIVQSFVERGVPPTLRELGNLLGIRSTNGVNDHLRALERKGLITIPPVIDEEKPDGTRRGAMSRGIRLVDDERLCIADLSPGERKLVRDFVAKIRARRAA